MKITGDRGLFRVFLALTGIVLACFVTMPGIRAYGIRPAETEEYRASITLPKDYFTKRSETRTAAPEPTSVPTGTAAPSDGTGTSGGPGGADVPIADATVFGDANGDDKITALDLAVLRQYLANYNAVTGLSSCTVSPGADADDSGDINTRDLALLRRYLAGYDPMTGRSDVELG